MTTIEILSGLFAAFVIAAMCIALAVFVYGVCVTIKTRLVERASRKIRLYEGRVS